MRAVFDIVAGQNLLHEPPQLLIRRLPSGLDGRFAGDGVQQIVAQAVRVERFSGQQIARQLLQKRLCVLHVHVGWDLPDEHVSAAEVLRLEPAALQKRPVFQHGSGLFP